MPADMATKFNCEICGNEDLAVSVKRAPPEMCATSQKVHQYACFDCWEAHLSFEVERKHPLKIECMFCTNTMGETELKGRARAPTLRRYKKLLERTTSAQCLRRCLAGFKDGQFIESLRQPHNRDTDGSVFKCLNRDCGYKYCVDCERPDHPGETCDERRARVELESQHNFNPNTRSIMPSHAEAYAMTKKQHTMCPSCGVCGHMDSGCGYVECKETNDKVKANKYGCNFRFCKSKDCMIDWVGDNSAYLGGAAAHRGKCKYIHRAWPSEHTLRHRFQETDPTKLAELKQRADKKKQKAASKGATVAECKDNQQGESELGTAAVTNEADPSSAQPMTKKPAKEATAQAVRSHTGKRSIQGECEEARPAKALKAHKPSFA